MLWIISQDKQSLINPKEVTVNKKKIKGIVGTKVRYDWSKDLGKYETEARTLEVLHEIFMKIEESNGASVTFAMPEK
ncbi:hypothetical protein [Gracilibacillus timonensis]|uniref:hypothetical protein n=1 Tax=Gracilibacillus timonensis TaxID=1816696 RepID=UPI000825F25F|nr:hypothetical protein [Gracilibacillus timonensis]